MKRAVIYIRTATPSEMILKAQHDTCLAFCERFNLEVVGTLAETVQGLTLEGRPKMDELRKMMREGHVDAVVVHTIDRLARGFEALTILVSEAEEYNVEIHSATEVSLGELTPEWVAEMMAERELLALLLRKVEEKAKLWRMQA